jgi:hypothetical protein
MFCTLNGTSPVGTAPGGVANVPERLAGWNEPLKTSMPPALAAYKRGSGVWVIASPAKTLCVTGVSVGLRVHSADSDTLPAPLFRATVSQQIKKYKAIAIEAS